MLVNSDFLQWIKRQLANCGIIGRRSPRATRRRNIDIDWGHIDPLESRQVLTVTYHGGALLSNVETQAVYLGSDWATSSSLQTQATSLDQFLAYIVKSPYMDMLTQAGYNVGEGTSTAGVVANTALSNTVTDTQIQTYLQELITSGKVAAPDANRLYVVYVEPGVVVKNGTQSSQNTFLGYHGAFSGKSINGQAIDIHYDVLPYPGSPNPSPASQGYSNAFDELTSVTSHELAEAVTDPNVNYKTAGWYDDQLNGEIGDLTRLQTSLNNYVVQDMVNKSDQPISPSTTNPTPNPNPAPNPSPTVTAPQNVTATALSSTSAKLTWSGDTNAREYAIYQVNGKQRTLLGTVSGNSTSVQVTGLASGSTASFVVESVNGTAVSDSAIVTVQLPASTLTAPIAYGWVTSPTTATLTWGAVAGAQGYSIYVWDGAKSVLLGTVDALATSVQITGLSPGTTYSFRVVASNGTTQMSSGWLNLTTPPTTYHGHSRFNLPVKFL